MIVISFEGSIGAGKTSLTNFFSHEFKCQKVLEDFEANPFLNKFYEQYGHQDVNFETEISFLPIHYYQIRKALQEKTGNLVLMDFSIEKDLVYAKMNLRGEKLAVFENVYNYISSQIGFPDLVIYIEVSPRILKRRIFQRGRPYEMEADLSYFEKFDRANKNYFLQKSKSEVVSFNVDDLVLEPDDPKIIQIRETILKKLEMPGRS
ncbi:MAG: deoxynucleoside kinase [Deltaproteobacteria bacterium]|nr:deoxynucleoside kinase [Deltaproteobacteria bacterium]MBW2046497.1 deoxynucleoside kinase [Deltaproteobacteria bacterium]